MVDFLIDFLIGAVKIAWQVFCVWFALVILEAFGWLPI